MKMERISKHISYEEATRSATALRSDIDNDPNEKQLENMRLLAENIFEPLRNKIGKPIRINSFFRSEKLNKKVGGSKTSQHTAINGAAIDISINNGYTNKDLFYWIKDNLEFDQLIYEFGDDNNPAWVHVSYNKGKNRGQVLRAYKEGGKSKYKQF